MAAYRNDEAREFALPIDLGHAQRVWAWVERCHDLVVSLQALNTSNVAHSLHQERACSDVMTAVRPEIWACVEPFKYEWDIRRHGHGGKILYNLVASTVC